ncbi:MAG: ABC transporter ATP-binding protein [Gemmatimonadetes bacterium]|nr:ABC transporter ATP-binding protein [Gemmatimonadota bacterium]MCY3677848.1 ABC transporter ATP-binding protein [Gemmatimonadota bacterium]MYA42925.1 ABC transporter ATP-binding protein [Gemmatimonadota bacterium]MYE93834.1 ABC transporter ATP-binding protein [Gemmatimonadota bacterium]MYJ12543.1 ABC transporter ATP-binding protein [Gemmatimonadota bacterium]
MVHLSDVTKYYGKKRALGPVSFEIERGDTVGFLGLNGVGKTTLLKILACGLRPSSGTVTIDGLDILDEPHEVRKRVGYLPELPPVYGDMTVGDYLNFAGRIRGLTPEAVARRVPEVEEYARIAEVHDMPTRNLSQGYRQRVGVAQAIIHDPDLLILDEPTHDLDPVQIMEMRGMIRALKDSHTILISSHILPEISQTCDRLLILNDGEIVASGTEAELGDTLLRSRGMVVTVRPGGHAGVGASTGVGGHAGGDRDAGGDADTGGDTDAAAQTAIDALERVIRSVPGVTGVRLPDRPARAIAAAGALTIRVYGEADVRAPVCRSLVEAGHDVIGLTRAERELERVFVELVGRAEA